MPKITAALGALLLLGACNNPLTLTNEQIIAETKKCESAGLMERVFSNNWDGGIYRIECWPRNQPNWRY